MHRFSCKSYRFYWSSYVVKTGLNFGVDYCIYHGLPSEYHSEMCVTVVDATGGSVSCGYSALGGICIAEAEQQQGVQVNNSCLNNNSTAVDGRDDNDGGAAAANIINARSVPQEELLSWRHISTLTRVVPVREQNT